MGFLDSLKGLVGKKKEPELKPGREKPPTTAVDRAKQRAKTFGMSLNKKGLKAAKTQAKVKAVQEEVAARAAQRRAEYGAAGKGEK